jgi:hypothetical protein
MDFDLIGFPGVLVDIEQLARRQLSDYDGISPAPSSLGTLSR